MSWTRSFEKKTVQIFFNRDESRARPVAIPPRIQWSTGTSARWIAATDPVGDGTWLAVNAKGLAVAILNYYQGEPRSRQDSGGFTSRGRLVSRAVEELSGLEHARNWLQKQVDEDDYRAFLIVLLDSSDQKIWKWDSGRLSPQVCELPITTSSFATEEVVGVRRLKYEEKGGGEPFHRWKSINRPAHSTIMERSDAMTVSLSRIEIGPEQVSYGYATGPDWGWGEPVVLNRA